MTPEIFTPDWPAPPGVKALQTTRTGGISLPPYDSFNLGDHVGDNPAAVEQNRQLLSRLMPSEPVWLKQVHGNEVIRAEAAGCHPQADACVTERKNAVCVVMTADCLPVLFCDDAASVVGAAHAGWRGLADGVLEAAVNAMQRPASSLMAWLGPAIGPSAFEVGAEVREIFLAHDAAASVAFTPPPSLVTPHKYFADIYLLARQRLQALGITRIYGGGECTHSDSRRYFSYRRDGVTGRMGSFIWLSSP